MMVVSKPESEFTGVWLHLELCSVRHMPCPRGVEIPEIFKLYNSYQFMKSNVDKYVYNTIMRPSNSGANQCVTCGICEHKCPQGLKISELLKKVHNEFVEKHE
jgi:predicted aldo/keto reductase-like oxidoreductase